ncbi:hypothetical protein D9757_007364 [Collybiopsis confluens]|uniref:Uncharacterized protein n=1 Tax=Collybiopsis confluens TaxID=2823264 RepID=A0A8H5M7V7_9AGAR|nr:hypothetical protein D9757_007364 [Collybiopsis confluens]
MEERIRIALQSHQTLGAYPQHHYYPRSSLFSDIGHASYAIDVADMLFYSIRNRISLDTTAWKVVKGFLSPSSAGTGLGIGNPNTEFSPNVTACALTSEGGTAKIAWGFRNGEVAVMTAARTMETSTRSAARLTRSKVDDDHEGEVTLLEWDDTGAYIVSAGKDGRIKVWDAKKVRYGGEIWVWAQIPLVSEGTVDVVLNSGAPRIRIPYPVHEDEQDTSNNERSACFPTSLLVDTLSSNTVLHAFVTYATHSEFWGVFFEYSSSTYKKVKYYCDETVGEVTALLPCLSASYSDECSFVIAGHQLGWVTVYSTISFTSNSSPLILPTRKFEAHLDGSGVTALAWNDVVLVTGSDRGDTTIFDACTFRRLRVLSSPVGSSRIRGVGIGAQGQAVSRGVKQILLGKDRDFVVACVGDSVTAFKADPVPRNGSKTHRMAGKKKSTGTASAKGYKKLILDQLITECLDEHEKESKYLRNVYKREREHRENLDRLGLDEVEAVEYALMLSRDEALERVQTDEHAAFGHIDDGVFEGDFDDILTSVPSTSRLADATSEESTPSLLHQASVSSLHSTGTPSTPKSKSRPIETRTSPSSSNRKIQVSPRSRAEPLEAGWGGESVSTSVSSSSRSASVAPATSLSPSDSFPLVQVGAGPHRSFHPPAIQSSSSCSSSSSSVGSPKKVAPRGAWGKPLKSTTSSNSASNSMRRSASLGTGSSSSASATIAGYSSLAHPQYSDDDMDEDLRLAIELSLTSAQEDEGRRRGE